MAAKKVVGKVKKAVKKIVGGRKPTRKGPGERRRGGK